MEKSGKKRILIVDDSPTVALILRGIIDAESDMMVVGHARNGYEAVNMTQVLRPDLITMDIRMPFMDGFDAIEKIMIVQPTPIIVVSAKVNDEQLRITFNAIKLGALAVVEKPENITQDGFEHMRSRLVQTIRLMAEIKVVTHKTPRKVSRHEIPVVTDFKKSDKLDYKIVALGVSTGGPVALQTILSELPKNFPVPIVIVQHMSPGFLGGFIKWLQDDVILPISLAIDKEQLLPGHIYFAPDQKHLSIVEKGGSLFASVEASRKPSSFCPSINVLFKSLSKIGTGKVLAGILTGMSGDGIPGMCALYEAGHYTFSQDIKSSIVSGMIKEAIESKCVYDVVSLDNIAKFMIKKLQGEIR